MGHKYMTSAGILVSSTLLEENDERAAEMLRETHAHLSVESSLVIVAEARVNARQIASRDKPLVVSRHPGAVEWLRRQGVDTSDVRAEVTADEVKWRPVIGNVPLHLAVVASSVTAIEFAGPAPRGAEFTAEDMERAGARLRKYIVLPADQNHLCGCAIKNGWCDCGRANS